jgi:hypothetical protein
VLCRLAPQQAGGEQMTGEQLAALSLWVLTVTSSQALDETMRVVHSSKTYEVTNVEDTHSWRTAKRANLRRFPYNFLFRETDGGIRILVVRHHARNPRYGAKRK